jgi:hypothetical protein
MMAMQIQKSQIVCLLALASSLANVPCQADMTIRVDEATGRHTFYEGDAPVLTYNFGNVPVPEGVGGRYAVARSDYVHPLYGPTGEILTKDFSPDHPHHRGIYWAWPEVTYKGEKRDLHALQGVFARPVRIVRQHAEANSAVLEAENVWKWGDDEPIVREHALICVHASKGQQRLIDFEFRFEALKESVSIARRGQSAYGGLNIRFSSRQGQKIVTHTDPPETQPRRTWAELVGVPPGGEKPVGIVILQDRSNPHYPGDWVQYPGLNWLQPTFPKSGAAYELIPGKPLGLKYRLIIRDGEMNGEDLAEQWDAYGRLDE